MILPCSVKVQRYVVSGQSATGATTRTLSTVIESLLCDLQPEGGTIIVPAQGQTAIYYKNMFCNPADIKVNDIITDLNTNEKFKVITTNSYWMVKHMEIRLEGGTVQ